MSFKSPSLLESSDFGKWHFWELDAKIFFFKLFSFLSSFVGLRPESTNKLKIKVKSFLSKVTVSLYLALHFRTVLC